MNQFEEAIQWVRGFQKFGIKPGLERMKWMLEQLGNPQNRLKFVHIAGTNGKGSTVQYISSVLQEAGYEVGTFTSPAIESFTSRIQWNGKSIPDTDFVKLTNRLKPLVLELEHTEWGSLTEFELTTIMAILYFATISYPDLVIWETGLGGRLDSTNVVNPIVAAITNIGFDHMEILGDSLEQIAAEKAGIMKSGVATITTEDNMGALQVLASAAKEKKSRLYQWEKDFTIERITNEWQGMEEKFHFQGPFGSYRDLKIKMLGAHQIKNAALAVMVLELLRQYYAVHFEAEQLTEGLAKANWPGRFEIIKKDPFLILDGAHNIEGIEALIQTIQERFANHKVKVLFSAFKDKDASGMIDRLASYCDEAIITGMEHSRSAEPADLEMLFRDANPNLKTTMISDWQEALKVWQQAAKPDELLLATGSLNFIADIRMALGKAQAASSDFQEKAGD